MKSDDLNEFLKIRGSEQRIVRRDYFKDMPEEIRMKIINAEYYLSPEREVIIMDLLDKQSTRNKFTRSVNDEQAVINFVRSFRSVPRNVSVYVWSNLKYGPVYRLNLKWALDNYQYLWNEANNYNLNIINENGKIGLMVSPNHNPEEYGEYNIEKWGLI